MQICINIKRLYLSQSFRLFFSAAAIFTLFELFAVAHEQSVLLHPRSEASLAVIHTERIIFD